MRLVYTATGKEVRVGDRVKTFNGDEVTVTYFRPPHKPSSSGKVSVKSDGRDYSNEYFVSVIGAEWIEREDRE